MSIEWIGAVIFTLAGALFTLIPILVEVLKRKTERGENTKLLSQLIENSLSKQVTKQESQLKEMKILFKEREAELNRLKEREAELNRLKEQEAELNRMRKQIEDLVKQNEVIANEIKLIDKEKHEFQSTE